MAPRNTTGTRAFPPAMMAIKEKLEAIAALWRYIMLMCPCPRTTIEPVYGGSNDIQGYEMEVDYDDLQPSTKPRLPTGTADDLVRALIVWNYCVLTTFMVTEVLKRTLDGAKFELGSMDFLAKARFRFERAKRGHTVVTIANKEDGKMHILDLTLEQFGWPKEDWLLPIADYYTSYVELQGTNCKQDKRIPPKVYSNSFVVFDRDLKGEGQKQVLNSWYFPKVRELLDKYDWDSWTGYDVLAELAGQIDDISREAAEHETTAGFL